MDKEIKGYKDDSNEEKNTETNEKNDLIDKDIEKESETSNGDNNEIDKENQILNISIDNPIEFNESFFSRILTGVGKSYSAELYNKYLNKVDSEIVLDKLFNFLENIRATLFDNTSYTMFSKDGRLFDFYFKDLEIYDSCEKESLETNSELLETFYSEKDKQDRLHAKSVDIHRLLTTNIDRCLKKIKILNATLEDCAKKEIYKVKNNKNKINKKKIKKKKKKNIILNKKYKK